MPKNRCCFLIIHPKLFFVKFFQMLVLVPRRFGLTVLIFQTPCRRVSPLFNFRLQIADCRISDLPPHLPLFRLHTSSFRLAGRDQCRDYRLMIDRFPDPSPPRSCRSLILLSSLQRVCISSGTFRAILRFRGEPARGNGCIESFYHTKRTHLISDFPANDILSLSFPAKYRGDSAE
jgi:hypothetical protein